MTTLTLTLSPEATVALRRIAVEHFGYAAPTGQDLLDAAAIILEVGIEQRCARLDEEARKEPGNG